VPPPVKLRQIVRAHQPHETPFRIAAQQRSYGVDRVAGAQLTLDRGDPDSRAARQLPGRGDPRAQRRHAGRRLERIAGRDQPPGLVQPQRIQREQSDSPVPAMRRVEATSEQAGHRTGTASRARRRQGRSCPVPRTSHL